MLIVLLKWNGHMQQCCKYKCAFLSFEWKDTYIVQMQQIHISMIKEYVNSMYARQLNLVKWAVLSKGIVY